MEIAYSILCVACLCMGFIIGYSLNKPPVTQETKTFIKKKPDVKKMREQEELDEEMRKTMEKYETILDNINNYDGSSNNQRKVK